ncbi:MAG: hypothetical protein MMC23_001057 [Stictis urceolatum]|nr:hypothetical protein [Stictis urceolata]
MIQQIAQESKDRWTSKLEESPYSAKLYLSRAEWYSGLGLPDLAAGDAYKALLLSDEIGDESGEYHEQAVQALPEDKRVETPESAREVALSSYQMLIRCLIACGCLKSAHELCTRGLKSHPDSSVLQNHLKQIINNSGSTNGTTSSPSDTPFDPSSLPDSGLVRRELYPWNTHEPNRYSASTLSHLNASLAKIAPKLSARVSRLPILSSPSSEPQTSTQLGLFANTRIAPGEQILHEASLLTANNGLHDSLCDACSGEIPPLSSAPEIFACADCDDTVFCSSACLSAAMESYHPAVCGADIDTIAKDVPLKEIPDALYFHLLARVIAMAETQSLHPLDLSETRFLWGEFLPPGSPEMLPWSFKYNVLFPIHVLEKMNLDIFKGVPRYDTWILNTLCSKFRGVASGRVNPLSGRPEVCAVHPFWSLANHSCAPNVRWEWGGEIGFWAREGGEVVRWGDGVDGDADTDGEMWRGGIEEGEEVLNHYCDLELPVEERREWAKGALGGLCRCPRCIWEAGEDGGNGVESGQVMGKGKVAENGKIEESEKRSGQVNGLPLEKHANGNAVQ